MENILERLPKARIFVKPTSRTSYQNRHLQEARVLTSDGRVESKGTMGRIKATAANGRSCIDGVVFARDEVGRRLLAGMGEAISPNPFKGDEAETVIQTFNLSSKWRGIVEKVVGQDSISRQQYLEILAGVDPDTYTERLSGKRIGQFFDPDSPKTVLETMEVKLYDKTNVFDSSTPQGRLEIQLIRSRPDRVAASIEDINTSYHNFYVAEEHEEHIMSKKKNDLINEAIAEFVMLQRKQPQETLYKFASVLLDTDNRPLVKGETTPMHVEEVLNAYIKNSTKNQTMYVGRFLDLVKLFTTNKDMFHMQYVVQVGMNKGVFTESNGYIFWLSKREQPEHYKFTSRNQLINFLYAEMDKYDPKDDQIANGYGDVLGELATKGVKIQD